MAEDLADRLDDLICTFDNVVSASSLDTVFYIFVGWVAFGAVVFLASHFLLSNQNEQRERTERIDSETQSKVSGEAEAKSSEKAITKRAPLTRDKSKSVEKELEIKELILKYAAGIDEDKKVESSPSSADGKQTSDATNRQDKGSKKAEPSSAQKKVAKQKVRD